MSEISSWGEQIMNSTYSEGTLKIVLPNRIDARNANEFEEELFLVPYLRETQEILLDADQLSYISSMGLRVFKTLRDELPNTSIKISNVSPEIYEVLDVTGFTTFFKVWKKLRFVELDSLKMLGMGVYGSVYRINEEQILKVFNGIDSEEAIQPTLNTIRTAFIHNISTIMPFEIVRTEKGLGAVLELLNSEMLSVLMKECPEKLDEYINDLVELAKSLANTSFEEGDLRTRNEMLLEKLKPVSAFLTAEEVAAIEGYINAVPIRNTGVHGDLHGRNVMMVRNKLTLIDMDDFSCGHPLWDIANIHHIYQLNAHLDSKMGEDIYDLEGKVSYKDFYVQVIGFTFDEADHIWDRFFQGYFADYSEEERKSFLKLIEFYSKFKFVTFLFDRCEKFKNNPEKLANKLNHIKRVLSELSKENLPELIKALDYWK